MKYALKSYSYFILKNVIDAVNYNQAHYIWCFDFSEDMFYLRVNLMW